MNSVKIYCQIDTNDPFACLGVEAWIDDVKFFDTENLNQLQTISTEISDDEHDHELRFVLKHKKTEHTKIDTNGNIVSDARLVIKNLMFDEFDIEQPFIDNATYTHDFNGSRPQTTEKFYGEMGCNGTVSFKFTTPIYLWLLENM